MINRSVTEILIGAVVVATAIWFLYYTSTRTNIMTNEDSYNLSADFRSVEGVSLGTDVRLVSLLTEASVDTLGKVLLINTNSG